VLRINKSKQEGFKLQTVRTALLPAMVDLASLQSDPCLQKSRRTARDLYSKQHNPSFSSFSQHYFFRGRTPFTWQLGSFQELKSAKERWEELKLGKVHLLSFKAI